VLSTPERVALTLRLVAGLTNGEVARAFLTGEGRIAQRVARAKRLLAEEGAAFGLPDGRELAERLCSVLGVVYLVFGACPTRARSTCPSGPRAPWTRPGGATP
jgi:predicted RNA polymerase sigma factor